MRRLDLDRAAEMWAAGATVEDIAVALGSTRSGMAGLIYRNRDRFARRIVSFTPEEREAKLAAGLEMIAAGRSRVEAARAVAVAVEPETFKYWLSKNMERTRGRGARGGPQGRAASRADTGADAAMEFAPAKAGAFRALEGRAPRDLVGATGCRWPIQRSGDPLRASTTLVCDAPRVDAKASYCATHRAMAFGRGTTSERAALNGIGGRA